MSYSERITHGMAYGFGGIIGAGLAVAIVTAGAPLLREVFQYLAPLF
ncbi:hypothetical protein NL532_31940 [Mesorhizobium sp. C120A]|nr:MULTISPECIES: hypothetical protein [unclassified Mesorhizobium]ESZ63742.1 hypothetical protein X728_08920 [Mesorhizobium sp. L103C120A0]WJI45055.1 hypothetical protein NL532_31940 [Mesorhizobium sp. C120A]